ncbi:hypothetical protein [Luethyella okanaganae]|uniref:Integral membrane protein n=1 Tax=Luethyella okanaganae TaxID=69372 RepID=A0ABW1VFS5_9MICO
MNNAELQALVERLETENAELRGRLGDAQASRTVTADAAGRARAGRSRWWTVLSSVLIVVGLVLAPLAAVANWAKTELSDTDSFVATFAPLAKEPAVQSYVTDQVVTAIEDQVDIPALTSAVFDGIADLGLPPRAADALRLLEKPAAAGLSSLVTGVVEKLVTSAAFADIWAQALRISHSQFVATIQGSDSAAVSVGSGGQIGIQLGPIIAEVKTALVAQGIAFAESIPVIDKTIVVATSDTVTYVQIGYNVAIAAGTWLPWVALLFLVAGVLVARRRVVAVLWAGIGLALVMTLLGIVLSIGRVVFVASMAPSVMPADTAGVIYDRITGGIGASVLAVTVLAVTVVLVTWLSGPFRVTTALRGLFSGWIASLRRTGEAHKLSTGRFGELLYRQRVVVRVVVSLVAAAVILFVRPLSPALIVWTAVLTLVVLGISEIVQRPITEVPESADEDTPVVVG